MQEYFGGASKSENKRGKIIMNLTNDNFSLTRVTHLNDFCSPEDSGSWGCKTHYGQSSLRLRNCDLQIETLN